jgi:acyl-homoserine lactone acylase PvdQ
MKWYQQLLFLFSFLPYLSYSQFNAQEISRYKSEAKNVTIIRDKWGIPHIYGKTDADAVFGLLYAQCEENFPRIERNYLEMMGRLSEVDGKNTLYQDLEMQLIYDTTAAINDYKNSPAWLHKLLDAFADGINFYLYTHPSVKPAVFQRFQPWFPLIYTDGSIGPTQTGGLKTEDIAALYKFSDGRINAYAQPAKPAYEYDPMGSNGMALAPSRTQSKNAILYINPHVTFYFRDEVQMVSEEGLNAYGAVTWGQFFVYQGFNEHCGWMHTSSIADVADLYREKINQQADSYEYDGKQLPIKKRQLVLRYKGENGLSTETITSYSTLHGPVMGSRNGAWLSLKERNRSMDALMQSWLRTKAKGFDDFKKVMDIRANNSNNTVFADDKGNIAYWHGNFMPVRDAKINWNLPVDGSTSSTEWKGVHVLDEIVHVYNPASGYIQNCNSTPFTVSGTSSPKQELYPVYMAPDGQNYRAVNAARLLEKSNNMTMDDFIHNIGYSHYLAAFEVLMPPLLKAYDELDDADSLKQSLREPILMLKSWDRNAAANSIPCALAIEWGYRMITKFPPVTSPEQATNAVAQMNGAVANTSPEEKLKLLKETLSDLEARFGTWLVPWGDINRYQRAEKFDDNKPSLPVGIAAATWGSLPSFTTRKFPYTNKRYGMYGNSFVACVEFGKKVKAKTIVTGGESFDPKSKHFTDQAQMYIDGNFKDVLYYKEDVMKNVERQYHPGE